jgi:hypothetical protein
MCVLGGWLGIIAHRPYDQADKLKVQNDEKRRRSDALKADAQHAETQIKALESPEGIDLAARPLGWVSPGETPIRPAKH